MKSHISKSQIKRIILLGQKYHEYYLSTRRPDTMQANPQPEQITKTVVGVTTIFIGGIALLSSVFVVPAGEVGVVTTLGKVSNTPRDQV